MSGEKIKATGTMKSERAIALFEEILNHIKEGGIHFENNGQSLELVTSEAVEVEVEAKRKNGKQKLEFELTWKDGLPLHKQSEEGIRDFKFSSKSSGQSAGAHETMSDQGGRDLMHGETRHQKKGSDLLRESVNRGDTEEAPVESAVF